MSRKRQKINQSSPSPKITNVKTISFFSRIKEFIVKNFVALLSLLVAIILPIIIYQISVLEPDIRPTKNEPTSYSIGNPVIDKDGGCNYHSSLKLPFKNLAWKSGYVDKVTFASERSDMLPKFELVEIDRSPIDNGTEKDIEIKFIVMADPISCSKLWKGESLDFEMKFYDNRGKLLNKDIAGNSFSFAGSWDFGTNTQYQNAF